MSSSLVLQDTLDGSHTFYIPALDEHYHSLNGAVQESRHVYIEAAFNHCRKKEIHVLELGFGTGLNALLTFLEAEKRDVRLRYTTLEKYPLEDSRIHSLNYASLSDELFMGIHQAAWNVPVFLGRGVLHKIQTDFHDYRYSEMYDVVYYDAFAPDKQPDVWAPSLFAALYASMSSGGVLSTYCAKGEIRRRIQNAGFSVNRLPGPPGKREMLQAFK